MPRQPKSYWQAHRSQVESVRFVQISCIGGTSTYQVDAIRLQIIWSLRREWCHGAIPHSFQQGFLPQGTWLQVNGVLLRRVNIEIESSETGLSAAAMEKFLLTSLRASARPCNLPEKTPRRKDITLNHLLPPIGTKMNLNAVLPLHISKSQRLSSCCQMVGPISPVALSNPLTPHRHFFGLRSLTPCSCFEAPVMTVGRLLPRKGGHSYTALTITTKMLRIGCWKGKSCWHPCHIKAVLPRKLGSQF